MASIGAEDEAAAFREVLRPIVLVFSIWCSANVLAVLGSLFDEGGSALGSTEERGSRRSSHLEHMLELGPSLSSALYDDES